MAETVHLSTVTRTQGNNRAVTHGEITPTGFTLDLVEVPVLIDAFRRMVRTLEFDVSEMSVTTYLAARERGVPFTAIPVFLARGLHHGAVCCRADSEITDPVELTGRRVGVNRGYTVTTGVWARGILAEEYGLDLNRVTWVLSGDEHVSGFRPPRNVVRAPAGADLKEMLLAKEIDAVVGASFDHPDIRPLLPDPAAAAWVALRRGLYPINHLLVVRDDVLRARPDAAAALFAAFAESKRRYLDQLKADTLPQAFPSDALYRMVAEVTGDDPLPYGIGPNRAMLETLTRYAVAQGILRGPVDLDELFAETSRDLAG